MKRVMIVDDALFIRNALKIMLEKSGFDVCGMASDGREAVKLYPAVRPDIVTMDITMPGMNGIEALKAIRKIDQSAVIVMVSAMGSKRLVVEAIQSGAKNFIVKPFQEEQVIKVLESFK